MRLSKSVSRNFTNFFVIESVSSNGKRTTRVVEKLGNDQFIRDTYHVDDAEKWARDYVKKLNEAKDLASRTVMETFSPFYVITVGS